MSVAKTAGGSPSDAPQALPAFLKFGRFQLVARLGKGGMGDVFLAVARGVEGANKLLVIKRLHQELLEDDNMRTLFLDEGRLAARLNHPNVVQTYEVGEEAGVLFLSMEYLEGQPLIQLIKKLGQTPLDHVLAARIMSEALAGLHYAHELRDYNGTSLGLVHRDVSPQNVLVTYDGVTKVLDFGIAKVSEQQQQKTREGILKGKVAYMSPEQVNGEADRRSDVFSAGIVLWELLARRRLMHQSSMAKTLYRVTHGPPAPRLSSLIPDIDPALDSLVAKALKRSPNERFQTALAMRDALERYIAGTGRFVRQEELSAVMCDVFKNRRERIANQVRDFMVAAREAHSAADLPSMKGSARSQAESSQPTSEEISASEITEEPASPWAQAGFSMEPPSFSVPGIPHDRVDNRPSRTTTRTLASNVTGTAPPASLLSRRFVTGAAVLAAGAVGLGVLLLLKPNVPSAADTPAPSPTVTVRAAPNAPSEPVVVPLTPAEVPETAAPAARAEGGKQRTARAVAAPTPPTAAPSPKAAPAPEPAETQSPRPADPTATPTPSPGKRKYRTEF